MTVKSLIVVGIDGSEHGERALDWAINEAKLRGATIKVVTAWHVPAAVYAGGYAPMVSPSVEEATQKTAEGVASAAAEKSRTAGIDVETEVRKGQAAEALIQASSAADLLVVGTRGHGGFAGLLLGSVSAQCAHHSRCPVATIR